MVKFKSLVVAAALAMASAGAQAKTLDITAVDGGPAFTGQTASVSQSGSLLLGKLLLQRPKGSQNGAPSATITVSGLSGSKPFSLTQMFDFARATTCGAANCANFLSISTSPLAPIVLTQGRTIFTLVIDGFVEQLGSPVFANTLFLRPGKSRSLFLQASVSVQTSPAPVPVPAGGLLLLGGLGAILGLSRRRAA